MSDIVRKPAIPTYTARRNGNSPKMFQSVPTDTPDMGRAAAVKVTPPFPPGSTNIGGKDKPAQTFDHVKRSF